MMLGRSWWNLIKVSGCNLRKMIYIVWQSGYPDRISSFDKILNLVGLLHYKEKHLVKSNYNRKVLKHNTPNGSSKTIGAIEVILCRLNFVRK